MKKILILDDNPDTLEIVTDVLTYEKYEVKTASKSVGFIELAEDYAADLMIIDYQLDDGNGGDVCHAVKDHDKLKDTPIIMFSAFHESRLKLLDYHCDAIIAKPFDLVQFLTTVRKLIDKA